jgi:hypothetical protein
VGKDLLLEAIKSTFLALIPNKDVYKIISKMIVGRLEPIMSPCYLK